MKLFCLPTLSLCKALRTLFCWFHNDVISVLAPLTQPIFQDFTASFLTLTIFTRWFCPLVFFSLQRKKSYGNSAKMQMPSFPLCLIGFKSLQAWYSSWWFRFLYLIYNVHSVHCVQTEKSVHYFFLKKTSSTNFCNAGKMWLNWMMLVRETKVQLIYRQIGGFLVPHSNGGKYKFN